MKQIIGWIMLICLISSPFVLLVYEEVKDHGWLYVAAAFVAALVIVGLLASAILLITSDDK